MPIQAGIDNLDAAAAIAYHPALDVLGGLEVTFPPTSTP